MKKSIFFLLLCCIISIASAQQKPLQLSDYASWNRITRAQISADGAWIAYGVKPNEGDETLYIVRKDQSKTYKFAQASNPSFSEDGKWVTYVVSPSEKEVKKLREARKEVITKTMLLQLETGVTKMFERVGRVEFTPQSTFVALHKRKHSDDKSKHTGSDLILLDLINGQSLNIGNVQQFSFNRQGNRLAYTVDADEKVGNGLYLVHLPNMQFVTLDADSATYTQLVWDDAQALRKDWSKKGAQLAVFKGNTIDTLTQRPNEIVVVRDIGLKTQSHKVYKAQEFAGLAADMVISELGNLRWSEDGKKLFFGVKKQERSSKLSRDTIANVDVWHWNDEMIQSVQIRRANQLKRATFQSVLHLADGRFVQLSDDTLRSVMVTKNGQYALGNSNLPYITDVNWGESPTDWYRVDLQTGARTPIAQNVARTMGVSPDGATFLYFQEGQVWAYHLATGRLTNISQASGVDFGDIQHPYPNAQPSYGVAGWVNDGKHVILNHRFDLWVLPLDGSKGYNLTKGRGDAEEIRFRYVSLDPEEEYISLKSPLLLSAYGEWTKKSGFFQWKPGGQPEPLVFEDQNFGRVQKALNSNELLYTVESFVDYPDYYVSGPDFKNRQRITQANPQQAQFAWGKRVLIDFTNSKGQKLQGTLALPANYEPGKQYPMIVYFYETMSENHNVFSHPVYDDRPHISYYASNGYLVFQPDNVYEEGRPGTSALDCITSGVQEVIKRGYADPKRIGLQGHSWGGYQSSFILTQTDIFACVVTGAPPTNLEGFYNNLYGSTGTNHHGITEIGQLRMGRNVTPWSDRAAYQRENPMYHADKIKTPFLILHGTADGAVDWAQGMEFYNAARRLGKNVIFLSYPGEGHHLEIQANQKDFLKRMHQYFDHYLKDTAAPEWMTKGVPHLEKLYEKAK
jgi:dipeptidyl aminopeptidase/acylaminoacyl peptidase